MPASVIELADKFEMEVPAEARERMGENQGKIQKFHKSHKSHIF